MFLILWMSVKKMQIVKEFIQKLKDITNIRDFWKLKKKHFLLISDQAWVEDDNSKVLKPLSKLWDKLVGLLDYVSNYTQGIGVFLPD